MPVQTNDDVLTRIFYEYDMDRMLHWHFGVHITRSESMPSEHHFATLIRCRVERNPGVLGIGGCKYISFYVDGQDTIRFDPATLINRIRDIMLTGIKGAFWTDYLMNMWGYTKEDSRWKYSSLSV